MCVFIYVRVQWFSDMIVMGMHMYLSANADVGEQVDTVIKFHTTYVCSIHTSVKPFTLKC